MRWWFPRPETTLPLPQIDAPPYNPDDEPPPLEDVVQRGVAARRLLADPTLAEAFKDISEDFYKTWLNSEPDEVSKREDMHRMARALGLVRDKLITYHAAAQVRAARAA